MADTKAMRTIQSVLLSTQGATGEMLCEGLTHALKDGPAERHELQAELLKMVTQVLATACSDAKVEVEQTCQRKVDAAEAELAVRKADVASATEAVAAAQAAATAQKEKLEASQRQLAWEEEEHKRLKAEDEEKAQEVSVDEKAMAEVSGLLAAMAQQGQGEAISTYLRSNKGEPALVDALRSVLLKEPTERSGFDDVALEHLKAFLEQKVAGWAAHIEGRVSAKANVHAEALGAWCVKEVAGEHVQEATVELETAEASVSEVRQQLKEAKQAEQQEDRTLAQLLSELTLAGERARQCNMAVEALEQLVVGKVQAAATEETNVAMDVDAMLDRKVDAMMDVEMGTAIVA